MITRNFANTGRSVSEIGLGCWQLGADWGHVTDDNALRILETAVDHVLIETDGYLESPGDSKHPNFMN